jgi:pimeloyl-ACP methyl ester carboxylesterase
VEQGQGEGSPVVLLHQVPRSVDEYLEVQVLLASRHRTIAMDFPGYGSSDPVPGQPLIEDYARAVIDVLDARSIARATFVGHHTGAVVAVELAAAFADRVDRVILSGPIFADGAMRAELSRMFKQWRIAADGSHLKEKWDAFSRWQGDPVLVQRFVTDLLRAGETSEQGHVAVAHYRMEERVPRLRCPALLLYHGKDPFADPKRARPLRDGFKPAEEAFLDAGVFAANERPEAFAKAILDYLG